MQPALYWVSVKDFPRARLRIAVMGFKDLCFFGYLIVFEPFQLHQTVANFLKKNFQCFCVKAKIIVVRLLEVLGRVAASIR